MADKQNRPREMKTSELREQAIEALNQTPFIDISTDDGEVFRVWHPMLVDDETQARIERFQAGEDLDKDEDGNLVFPHRIKGKLAEPAVVRSARAVLGPERHKEFVKAGGHSADVQLAWNEMVRVYEEEDTILGEYERILEEDPK